MASNEIPRSYDPIVRLHRQPFSGSGRSHPDHPGHRRRLLRELGQLIDDDDDRWYAFGFSKPGDPDTPAVPEHLVVTGGSPGMVFVDWTMRHAPIVIG